MQKIISIILALLTLLGGYKWVEYPEYTDTAFEVPGLDTDFVPQGLCYVEDMEMFAISGYMYAQTGEEKENSRIYFVNPKTGDVKEFEIEKFTSHAGGIASSGKDIWVSSGGSQSTNGKVYHFTTDMFKGEDKIQVKYDGYFQVPTKGSALCCDGNKLWVLEFYNSDSDSNKVNNEHYAGSNHAWACGYDLPITVDYSAKVELAPQVLLSIPDKSQGMSITDSGNVVFSTSYGRKNNSNLYVFDDYTTWDSKNVSVFGTSVPIYIAKNKNRAEKIKMPTLMEGIDFENGKLYVLFESGAKAYSDAKQIISDVWELDINTMLAQ